MNTKNNITQEQLETIEKYLNGSMTTEEKSNFEQKMESDASFSQLVHDVKTMLLGIEGAVLKESLDTFHEEMTPVRQLKKDTTPVRSLTSRFARYAVAASIVLAIGLFFLMNQGSPSDKLYAKHFTPDPGLPTTMSTSNNFAFFDGMVDYKQGNYEVAIKKWKVLAAKIPTNDTLNYFLGVASLAQDKPNDAIPYLELVSKESNSSFNEEAYYYLGMAHLKTNNLEEAKENLIKSELEKSLQIIQELND